MTKPNSQLQRNNNLANVPGCNKVAVELAAPIELEVNSSPLVCNTPPQLFTSTQDISSSSRPTTSPIGEVYSARHAEGNNNQVSVFVETAKPREKAAKYQGAGDHLLSFPREPLLTSALSGVTWHADRETAPVETQLLESGKQSFPSSVSDNDLLIPLAKRDSRSNGLFEISAGADSLPASTSRYLKGLLPRPRRKVIGPRHCISSPSEASSAGVSRSLAAARHRFSSVVRNSTKLSPEGHKSHTSPEVRRNSLTSTLRKSFTLRARQEPLMLSPLSTKTESLLKEGPVQKSAGGYLSGGKWSNRYLFLGPGILIYANEDKSLRQEVPLATCSVTKDKSDKCKFHISRTNGKPWDFRVESEEERNLWCRRIVEAKQVFDAQSKQQFVIEQSTPNYEAEVEWSDIETETVPLKQLHMETQKFVMENRKKFEELSRYACRVNEITSWGSVQKAPDGCILTQIRTAIVGLLQEVDDLNQRNEVFEKAFKKIEALCETERTALQNSVKVLSKENFKLEKQLTKIHERGMLRSGSIPRDATTAAAMLETDATPVMAAANVHLSAETSFSGGGTSSLETVGKDEFFDLEENQGFLETPHTVGTGSANADEPLSLAVSSTSSSSVIDDPAQPIDPQVVDASGLFVAYRAPDLGLPRPGYVFRNTLPKPRTEFKISLWSLLKDCIGKDLSKIALPVHFNEPTSMLQRLAEDYQYAWLLEKAAETEDMLEALLYLAIFTTTPFASAVGRTFKPFNPLLGETYEITHRGFKLLAEQVGHHPPTTAYHSIGKGFEAWGHTTVNTKFTGKSLEVLLQGPSNIVLNQSLFTFQRARIVINNVIFGKMSMDVAGTYTVTNHTTGDYALIDFPRRSGWWRSEDGHQVRGFVCDQSGTVVHAFRGIWSHEISAFKPQKYMSFTPNTEISCPTHPYIKYESKAIDFEIDWPSVMQPVNAEDLTIVWKADPRPAHSPKFYDFGHMTFELNDINELYDRSLGAPVAPTDSRYRPDQRALEWGDVEESNQQKLRLEEKQRTRLRSLPHGERDHDPMWYRRCVDPLLHVPTFEFQKDYWACKSLQSAEEIRNFFSQCPDLF